MRRLDEHTQEKSIQADAAPHFSRELMDNSSSQGFRTSRSADDSTALYDHYAGIVRVRIRNDRAFRYSSIASSEQATLLFLLPQRASTKSIKSFGSPPSKARKSLSETHSGAHRGRSPKISTRSKKHRERRSENIDMMNDSPDDEEDDDEEILVDIPFPGHSARTKIVRTRRSKEEIPNPEEVFGKVNFFLFFFLFV
jgi:hypothetical protein